MGQTGQRSIATYILAVKIALAAAHFHGFGVARQGPWITSVNKAVPLAAAVSGWGDRRLAGSRLALAVGAHFVPSAADVHVAPATGAVLRGVVEGPAAPLVTAGLQSLPLALSLRPDHPREQAGHDALGRTIPGSGLHGGASVRPEAHPQGGGGNEAVQLLRIRPGFGRAIVDQQQPPQSLP